MPEVPSAAATLPIYTGDSFLDRLGLPAIRLNQELIIRHANPAACALLGVGERDLRGQSVFRLVGRTTANSEHFEKRREGQSEVYEVEFIRPSDQKRIPVSVAGTPIFDERGTFLGTLGILRSLERERVAEAIHRLVDTERDEQSLLSGVARELRALIDFDYLSIAEYSLASDHVSAWFTCSNGQEITSNRRWWPIRPEERAEYEQPLITGDLKSFLNNKRPYLKEDDNVRRFMAQDFRSSLRMPILQEKRVIASLSLFSKKPHRYSNSDLEVLSILPVEQAIRMALYYKNRRGFQF